MGCSNDSSINVKTKNKKTISNYEILYFSSDPKRLIFTKDLPEEALAWATTDDTFALFKSLSANETFIVYAKEDFSIECYDLNKEKISITIPKAHEDFISSIRHYPNKKSKRDYIITACNDCSIKLWDTKSWNCIVNIPNTHNKEKFGGSLRSVSFFYDKYSKQEFLITSSKLEEEFIKVWNMKGELIKKINESNDEYTYFIESFDDNYLNTNFIISGNNKYCKSFNFNNNELYKKYYDKDSNDWHMSIVIICSNNILKMIEGSLDGNIRIWDFHTAELIQKIKIKGGVRGLCLWNDKYLIGAGSNKEIVLVDIEKGYCIKNFEGHENVVCSVKKISLNNYGECLVSQGYNEKKIKLWTIEKCD